MKMIAHKARQKNPIIMILRRRRQVVQEVSNPLRRMREVGPTRVWLFQALLLDTMTTYTRRNNLTDVLRIKLTEVLYVPRIWQWFSILYSQSDTSRVIDLGYPEGALSSKHPPEH
jgi:hypothetical protein